MSRPLSGKTVVVTRSREQAGELVSLLEDQGAEVLLFPTIALLDPEDWRPADQAIRTLSGYDWAVFTSTNAVDRFMDRLAAHHLDARAFCSQSVAAVGPKTAERLSERGLVADVVPTDHRAEGVAEEIVAAGVGEGTHVLLPRALVAREVLPDTLRAHGAIVDVVPVYRNVLGTGDPAVSCRMSTGGVDAITFTSSSTVSNFMDLISGTDIDPALPGMLVASIGPVTSNTARSAGLEVDVEPESYTVPALVEAIAASFR